MGAPCTHTFNQPKRQFVCHTDIFVLRSFEWIHFIHFETDLKPCHFKLATLHKLQLSSCHKHLTFSLSWPNTIILIALTWLKQLKTIWNIASCANQGNDMNGRLRWRGQLGRRLECRSILSCIEKLITVLMKIFCIVWVNWISQYQVLHVSRQDKVAKCLMDILECSCYGVQCTMHNAQHTCAQLKANILERYFWKCTWCTCMTLSIVSKNESLFVGNCRRLAWQCSYVVVSLFNIENDAIFNVQTKSI